MKTSLDRCTFLTHAGVVALAATATSALAAESAGQGTPLNILGVSCSPSKGMTTAKAVQAALDAAKAVDGRISTT